MHDRLAAFRQALSLGGNARRGEHGTTVVCADRFIPEGEKRRAHDTGGDAQAIPFLKRIPGDLAVLPRHPQPAVVVFTLDDFVQAQRRRCRSCRAGLALIAAPCIWRDWWRTTFVATQFWRAALAISASVHVRQSQGKPLRPLVRALRFLADHHGGWAVSVSEGPPHFRRGRAPPGRQRAPRGAIGPLHHKSNLTLFLGSY